MQKHSGFCLTSIWALALSLNLFFCCAVGMSVDGGALAAERYRVVISSDIGGSDEDDIQSMIH